MSESLLPILQNPAVAARTSRATRRALEERAQPIPSQDRFLSAHIFELLQQITNTILPQAVTGTVVDIAASIDRRLAAGTNAGWRFAELPADSEAYKKGLTVFASVLKQTPWQSFDRMPHSVREEYLRSVATGDFDGPAQFPLSRWLRMLRADAVKIWLAHPSTMLKMKYYGFADGEAGGTNGPTDLEGWVAITQSKAMPFEQGIVVPVVEKQV